MSDETDDLNDRLIAALGPAPQRTSAIDAAGNEIAEDDADYQARYDQWRETFTPADLSDADYCARRYRQLSAKIGAVDAIEREQAAAIKEWGDHERARYASDLGYWQGRLETFHRAERHADPKTKTINLPCGVRLESTKGRVKVKVTDEVAAIGWLEKNYAAAVRYPEPEIDKTEATKAFGAKAAQEDTPGVYPAVSVNGEVVPGLEFERGEVAFFVK